jgi:ABC-type lipoprotein export system ATPase subunit
MIRLSGIRKVYKSKSGQEVVALDNVRFDLPESGLVFIIGKSGSGKSTMLNILGGLDSATAGEIELLGVGKISDKGILDAYRNTYLGFVFQEFHLLDTLTVYENIALALEMKGETASKTDVEKALERVDLGGLTNRYPEELSGGQKQRVAIARALIKNPHIILADEPTGNLDSATSKDIVALLSELSKERLVVVVTHDKDAAKEYGDRVIELKDGKVVEDTSKTNLETSADKCSEMKLHNAKFKMKSTLKFVLSALNHKKRKLVVSVLLSVIAIVMFGMSFVISTYDTEEQIAKNVKAAGTQSFIVSPNPNVNIREKGITLWDIFGDNKAVPSTMFDYMANDYPNTGIAGLYYGDWFHVP